MEVQPLVTFITLALTLILSFSELRRRKSEVSKTNTDAAGELTQSVLALLKPKDEEISRLSKKVSELVGQLSVIEQDRYEEIRKYEASMKALENKLTNQIDFMIGELRRSDNALEYIVGVVKDEYPEEAKKAVDMRRGKIT